MIRSTVLLLLAAPATAPSRTSQYTLTVTDTETGQVKRYENPSGRLASVADTAAF